MGPHDRIYAFWGTAVVLLLSVAKPCCGFPTLEPQALFTTDAWAPCADSSALPVGSLNLTVEEASLLDHICLPPSGSGVLAGQLGGVRQGIPPGVSCTPTQWCDGDVCTIVCERGTVAVEPWLRNAIMSQTRLVQSLPLCYATLLGTHNSAITLADGYGNMDEHFRAFFKFIRWAVKDFRDAPLRTNDQWLSVTDQLNLGVRALELDTHWVQGMLRIAHCGGFHSPLFNKLVSALNLVAKLMGRHIHWDAESVGCSPSLSSIPVGRQRAFVEALLEVKAWLELPENADEFVMLYLDDQPNLLQWGKVPLLLQDILSVFPRDWIYTTDEKKAFGHGWPTMANMVAAGRRVLFVSSTDYGQAMQPLIFSRGATVCRWTEPQLRSVQGTPECVVTAEGAVEPNPLFAGDLVRVPTCELVYGPFNCDFKWGGVNSPVFDEATLPVVMGCGLNMPSPDLLTPTRAAAAIWTWAPGHPFEQPDPEPAAANNASAAAGAPRSADCAVLSASDARWRAVPCAGARPSACRNVTARLGSSEGWVLSQRSTRLGGCPDGSVFDLPRHPRENYLLAAALAEAGETAAWLPVHGPDWSIQGWPADNVFVLPSKRQYLLVELPAATGLSLAALAGVVVVLLRRSRATAAAAAGSVDASAAGYEPV